MSLRFGVILLATGSVALTGCALETKGSPAIIVPAAQVSLGDTKVAPDMALPAISAPYYVTTPPTAPVTAGTPDAAPAMMAAPKMMMSPKASAPRAPASHAPAANTPAPKTDTQPKAAH